MTSFSTKLYLIIKILSFGRYLNCPNNDVYITVVYVIGSAEQSVSCSTQCRRCTCRRRRMARRRLGHRMMDFGHQCGRERSRMLNRVLAWLRLGSPRSRTGVRPLLLASQNRIQTHLEHKTPPHYLARHTAHSHTSCAFFNCIFVMFFDSLFSPRCRVFCVLVIDVAFAATERKAWRCRALAHGVPFCLPVFFIICKNDCCRSLSQSYMVR